MQQTDLSRHIALWRDGIPSEIAFWDHWMANRGGVHAEDFRRRLDPRREIDAGLVDGLDSPRVLDVGAGPVTILGSQHRGRPLDLVACDPLAEAYAALARRHHIAWPVRTVVGFAEYLTAFFPRNSFDLVHCRNALDHSFDPVRGIEEMLAVAKPGGRVVLSHARNEGVYGNYEGLHQWNLDADNGCLIVWNRAVRIDATQRLADVADIAVDTSGERWIEVRLSKRIAPPARPAAEDLRQLLAALVLAAAG